MTIELKVPAVGESIQEVQVLHWKKRAGDAVVEDEEIVELETDKAAVEIPAPVSGVLREILIADGETAEIGDVLALLDEGDEKSSAKTENGRSKKRNRKKQGRKKRDLEQHQLDTKGSPKLAADEDTETDDAGQKDRRGATRSEQAEQDRAGHRRTHRQGEAATSAHEDRESPAALPSTPAARRELRRHGLTAEDIETEGKRIRPEDVRRQAATLKKGKQRPGKAKGQQQVTPARESERMSEEIVPMSLLRRKIAQRLVRAQQEAALLTTFNEIDMARLMHLRKSHGPRFQERYGVKLGIMSFFVKAVVYALDRIPELNAEIRGGDKIAYRHYRHIGIAIGSPHGLVVPVLRHAEQLSFAEIERAIDTFARQAEQRELNPDDLQGGTFTISNGGIYGSLLSTPIVNPPQSGVLGMHAIQDRPIVRDKQIVVRPMMYVALGYDHRIVDGKEAVTFLRYIKEAIEDPAQMLLEL